MNSCDRVQDSLTEYLDGRLTGREMQDIGAHLQGCMGCASEWKSLREVQGALTRLGPVEEPKDLPLRIRVAVSQERARSHRSIFTGLDLAWKNSVGPFLLQASAGFLSAVLLLGTIVFMVSMFAQPGAAAATSDEPLGDATPARLLYYANAEGKNQANAINGPVVVEAFINDSGEVYDYRIVSGPTDAATRSQVENMLLLGRFAPARFFGQPVRGLAVLSFSGVSVRG
jgi:anti-sigma factor RsiW